MLGGGAALDENTRVRVCYPVSRTCHHAIGCSSAWPGSWYTDRIILKMQPHKSHGGKNEVCLRKGEGAPLHILLCVEIKQHDIGPYALCHYKVFVALATTTNGLAPTTLTASHPPAVVVLQPT